MGRFIAGWPADDQVGLLEVLGQRGSRLGRDGWMSGRDVIACLREVGLPFEHLSRICALSTGPDAAAAGRDECFKKSTCIVIWM